MITPPAITAPVPPAAIDTGNWAGYVWNGGSIAAAQFTVPSMPNPSAAEKANHTVLTLWDGLGDIGSPYIAQSGVYDYYDAGKINWAGFCAFWPETDNSCGGGIKTGDTMQVRITRSGYNYAMTLRDTGPYNKWVVTVRRAGFPALDQGQGIVEDSTYPGYPMEPLSGYSDILFRSSGDPATEVYSADAGFATKVSGRAFYIKRG